MHSCSLATVPTETLEPPARTYTHTHTSTHTDATLHWAAPACFVAFLPKGFFPPSVLFIASRGKEKHE